MSAFKPLKSPRKCYCFLCKKPYQLVLTRSQFFKLKKKAEAALEKDFEAAQVVYLRTKGRMMNKVEEKSYFKQFLDPLWLPCPDCLQQS